MKALAVVVILIVGGLLWARPSRNVNDLRSVSPGSERLRTVVEPITMLGGKSEAGSDDHWFGIEFKDANDVKFTAYYDIYRWAGKDYNNVLFVNEQEVPPSGPDERALLGLLQRWHAGDPEAKDLDLAAQEGRFRGEAYLALTEAQRGKLQAERMIRVLLRRNHWP